MVQPPFSPSENPTALGMSQGPPAGPGEATWVGLGHPAEPFKAPDTARSQRTPGRAGEPDC